jgi:hypothetical protein
LNLAFRNLIEQRKTLDPKETFSIEAEAKRISLGGGIRFSPLRAFGFSSGMLSNTLSRYGKFFEKPIRVDSTRKG